MTHTPATVLRDAAQWLDNDPKRWGRDSFIDPVTKCRRCAAGAISWVLAPLDTDGDPLNLRTRPETAEVALDTVNFLAQWLVDFAEEPMLDNAVEVIANFNDAPERTAADVIAAMRAAADEWDQRQKERAAVNARPDILGNEIPDRLDERYDPSPEPITRRIS